MTLLVCYGGTFDPVHAGHLAVARMVRDTLDADVRLLPAADPPHKPATFAGQDDRARMLALAIDGEPRMTLDLREYRRSGPSYTVDTLRALRDELGPRKPLAWLVGSDALPALHTWHAWRSLFELGHVLVVARPGAPVDLGIAAVAEPVRAELTARACPAASLHGQAGGGYAVLAPAALRPESSTDIRDRIRDGRPWHSLVPASVAGYIEARGLYRAGNPAGPPL